jgi:hypothetical protein
VKAIIGYAGMMAGGAVGWWLGSLHDLVLAAVLSGLGGGVGLYYARKLAADYLE